MTKVFRKYNKWLLAVFGSLLMVTFMIQGTAGQFQADPGDAVVATIGPEASKVRAREIDKAEFEYKALSDIVPAALRAPPSEGGAGIENGEHWYLITKEAQEAGLVGEAADGAEWIPDLAKIEGRLEILLNPQYRQFAQQLLNNPQMMASQYDRLQRLIEENKDSIGARANLRPAETDLALAKLRGVHRLLDTYGRAAKMSDATFTRHARELLTRASFDAVMISAERLIDTVPAPTEEQIRDIFEKYKGVRPGTGEYGFGYLRPKRVKLEWMIISRPGVSASITLDPIEVNKLYLQNRAEFPGEFAAEKTAVENKLREKKTQEVMDEADRAYRAILKSATRRMTSVGSIKKLPDDWAATRPTMQKIAEEVVSTVERATKIRMPAPAVTVRDADFIPLDGVRSLGAIAFMQFNIGGKQGTFEELIANTHELNPSASFGPQVGLPFEFPLTDVARDAAYFTVIDARGESPADSLDEVRPQVERDAKLLTAFNTLRENAPTYQALAVTDGLEGVANLFASSPPIGSPEGTLAIPLPIEKRVVMVKYQGDFKYPQLDDQGLRDAVLDRLHQLGPDMRPTPENVVLRTLAHPLPAKLSLAVLQITGQRPVSTEDMRRFGEPEVAAVQRRELRDADPDDAIPHPYSFKAVSERLQYKPVRKPGATTESAPADAANPS
ncbi:MAG: hypothetical protein JNK25_11300 [Phycisphaerae bacterium]|nr:hypothetical protein [Phycisphaerae bacterium]